MNDNKAVQLHEWVRTIEQEWGYRPLSCQMDIDNPKIIHATFVNPPDIQGDMRIKGFTVVPHKLVVPEPGYPFSVQFRSYERRRDRNRLTA